MLDKFCCIAAEKKWDFFEIILFFVFWQILSHERIDDVDDVSYPLKLDSSSLHILLWRRVLLFFSLCFIFLILVFFTVIFINWSSQHHKESKKNIEVVRLSQSFIDLCQKLTKYISASLIVEFLRFVILWLLLLRIKVDIDLIEIAFHVDLLEGSIVFPFLSIWDEVTQTIDAIGGNIFSITIAIVDLFLNFRMCYCFGTSPSIGILRSWFDDLSWGLSIFKNTLPLCLILMCVKSAG